MPPVSPDIPFPPEQPLLRWKPAFFHEKPLQPAGKPSFHAKVNEAFGDVDQHKGKILLVTRMSDKWAVFKYKRPLLGKADFNNIRLEGLPLGGNPFKPRTYIINGGGDIARIVHVEDRYYLEGTAGPANEITTGIWAPALVPIQQRNYGNNLTWLPQFAFRPSIDELKGTVNLIEQKTPVGTKIKAGGAQSSCSKIAVTRDAYILTHGLKLLRFLSEEQKFYRSDLGERFPNLVRFGSGVTIREANRYLWEHGKSFPLLGCYDEHTIGGVCNTGTHGSVITFGPLAEMIVSIDLVIRNGLITRIEPTQGITEPGAFENDPQRPAVNLSQDDDLFNATLINMGTMGVIHSFVLEVTDCFHLREVRTVTTVEAIKEVLKGEKIYKVAGVQGKPADIAKIDPKISDGKDGGFKGHPLPAYHLELAFNPHGNKVVVTSRHPVTVKNDKIFGFGPPRRDLVRNLFLRTRFQRAWIPTWVEDRWHDVLVAVANTRMKLFPKTTPSLIDDAMDTSVKKVYIDRSFNVFNIGEGQSRIPVVAGTIFIPLENDKYLDALDIITQRVAKQFAARDTYMTAPVSMRFVKKTGALLGCPKDYCAFEFIFPAGAIVAQEMISTFDARLRQMLNDEVRAHWGQLMEDPDEGLMRSMYPRYDRWRDIRDEYDLDNRFLNEWQTKILSPLAP